MDNNLFCLRLNFNLGVITEFKRIVQQIGHYPPQRLGASDDGQPFVACLKLHVLTDVLIITGKGVYPGV